MMVRRALFFWGCILIFPEVSVFFKTRKTEMSQKQITGRGNEQRYRCKTGCKNPRIYNYKTSKTNDKQPDCHSNYLPDNGSFPVGHVDDGMNHSKIVISTNTSHEERSTTNG